MVARYVVPMRNGKHIPHSSPWILEEDIAMVSETLRRGMIAGGALANEFEQRCAGYLGVPHAWAVGSGQAGILRALISLNIGPGSEVLMPSYVCRAVMDAVTITGASPTFCDIGEDWCINPQTVELAITPKTAAIVAVHPFGIVADIEPLLAFGIPIIEDCCQCFSPRVGRLGAMAVFSFHATKCLACAEGGLIATADPNMAARISESLEAYPEPTRLADMQAALGISQLSRYDQMLSRRRAIGELYLGELAAALTVRTRSVATRSIFFRFPISVDSGFDNVADEFFNAGIQVRRGVDALLHQKAGLSDARFPTTMELFRTTLSLPLYPALDDDSARYVLTSAKEILG